jgi:hypothetical protein
MCAQISAVESADKVSCVARKEEREARGLLNQLETPHTSTRDESRWKRGGVPVPRKVRALFRCHT